jgi:hypothetical protein
MKRLPPPLRFLVGVCAGWTCARAGILWMAQPSATDETSLASAPRPLARAGPAAAVVGPVPPGARPTAAVAPATGVTPLGSRPDGSAAAAGVSRLIGPLPGVATRPSALPVSPPQTGPPSTVPAPLVLPSLLRTTAVATPAMGAAVPTALPPPPAGRPWTVSAWAFARAGGSTALAPGGMLGGSQAGMRGTYRLVGREAPLAVSLRLSSPLAQARGAEAAAGLDWKPLARLPVHLLVERRQKLGPEGRSAFGATIHGGASEVKLGPLRLDGYGQAGILGLKRRDLFADGGIRLALPLGQGGAVRVGGGVWAAAQPQLSRVDLGPHAELRLPLRPANASLSADWRFRVAGNARPGSGPALTLAADF